MNITDIVIAKKLAGGGGGGGGSSVIPAPVMTATLNVADYTDVTDIESGLIDDNYSNIIYESMESSQLTITGKIAPFIGGDSQMLEWEFLPYIYYELNGDEESFNISFSDLVNCYETEYGGIGVTDLTKPCSCSVTCTK